MKDTSNSKSKLQTFRLSQLQKMEIELESRKAGLSHGAFIRSKIFKEEN